jgi:hypothetical protein
MSSPAIPGSVVEPSHVSQPHSYAARDFFNTMRDLVLKVPGFHNESDVQKALATIDGYEKHVTGADQAYVVSESDRAPVEDVSLRVPPQAGLPVLAPAQAIDYARLAAAIVAAGQQARAALAPAAMMPADADTHAVPVPPGGVPVITDAKAGQQPQVQFQVPAS